MNFSVIPVSDTNESSTISHVAFLLFELRYFIPNNFSMSQNHGTLNDARKISSCLSQAQLRLEASIAHAEAAAGALNEDGSIIKVQAEPDFDFAVISL